MALVIKFGVKTGQGGYDYPTLRKIWLEAERLGFDSAWLYDHFLALGDTQAPCLEAWTTLAALATETQRLRLGTMVTCYAYRHPALLAKMATTLDILSRGRLEFGIGAGWYEEEYRMHGYDFPKPATRVRQLREAIDIIRRLWTEERANYDGHYYRLHDAVSYPKPLQKPHPPIWIGISKGRQLMPRLAAANADAVNIPSLSPAECRQILDALRLHCLHLHRDYDAITKSWQGFIIIGKDDATLTDLVKDIAAKRGLPPPQYLDSVRQRGVIAGTPEECVRGLEKYIEVGFEYLILIFNGDEKLTPLETFAKEVIPHLAAV